MILQNLNPNDFKSLFPKPHTIYSTVDFCLLNRHKVNSLCFIAAYESSTLKPIAGIILGYNGKIWKCPFSAPFGEIAYNSTLSISDCSDFISELTNYFDGTPIQLTLAPFFYQSKTLEHMRLAAINNSNKVFCDYNYHFDLTKMSGYLSMISPAARRNLKRALTSDLYFEKVYTPDRCYSIIKEHYAIKHYTLHLSQEELISTAEIIPTDYFVVCHKGSDIAGAIIHTVSDGVAQLIYWSNKSAYENMRPMNFLAFKLCEYYASKDYRIFDFGPSSSDGIPSVGLCRFKESLGGILSMKPTFVF